MKFYRNRYTGDDGESTGFEFFTSKRARPCRIKPCAKLFPKMSTRICRLCGASVCSRHASAWASPRFGTVCGKCKG